MKDKELLNEIGIKQYAILNMDEIRQSIKRLKDFYREDGYYQADIRERIEELPQNEVALIYEIDEGQKMYISKIEFSGNNHFKDKELKDIMETSERGFLSWFTGSGVLDSKKLEYDIQKITAFYYNHGYIRVKVGEPDISLEGGKGITISLEIQEGPRFRVGKVKIEGDLIGSEESLLARIHIGEEEYYNLELIREDILALRKLYSDRGYAYAEVSPITKEDNENQVVDITFKIDQKKRVRFERINIYGNNKTRDKVIRRELNVVEGGYFSGAALQISTANLHRLGFFDDVEIQSRKGSRDDLMNLDINVKERGTGSFSIGVGYSTFESALAQLQISQNNLFGRGQRISANVRAGSRTTEFNIQFTEPWLLDRRLSAGVRATKWKTIFNEYTKDSVGGSLILGFPVGIDEFTKMSVGYAYDQSDITDIASDAALALREMEGENVTSSTTLSIYRNSKNRPWNTRSGSYNSFSFQYAGGPLGGDIYFNKYIAQSDWYLPYKWETVFVIRGKIGYVVERSGGFLPVFEKFFLGGLDTIRGYEYYSISPRDPISGDKIGGEKMWVYNLEYRFPLLKEQGVIGLVFFDAVNVFTKEENFALRGYRSIGGGFRWYSPVGPIRVEYGYKLDRRGDESSGLWDFSMGGSF
jgi:outer membrane protein insertion porin family